MRSSSPEPKGKLDAMTGYSFTTPVWDGGAWVTPAVAEVRAAPKVNGPEDQPRQQDVPVQWDQIDWRRHEGQVRRRAPRVVKGGEGAGLAKGRRPQQPIPRDPADPAG